MVRIARVFNTYGPRLRAGDGRVVSNFVVQALQEEELTVHGDGQQTRSFCYVTDMVEGLVRLMASEHGYGPVNLGNPRETTMLELASLIRRLADSSSKIVHTPLPKDDPVRRMPDITLARRLLAGWEPSVPLEEGLLAVIDDFRQRRASG